MPEQLVPLGAGQRRDRRLVLKREARRGRGEGDGGLGFGRLGQVEGLAHVCHGLALLSEHLGQVVGDRLNQPLDVVVAQVVGQGEAQARLAHGHEREDREVHVEPVSPEPLHHGVGDLRQAHADEADRGLAGVEERQLVLLKQPVAELELARELLLELADLLREVDAARGDRRPEVGGLDRPGEDHRAADHLHALAHGLVRDHQHAAAHAEGLGERRGDDQPVVARHLGEHVAAPMLAAPAHGVGVVEVDVELLVAIEQRRERRSRDEVAEHAVEAIAEEPDAAVGLAQILDQRLEHVHAVVADHLDAGPEDADAVEGRLHGVVGLLVEDHGVVSLDQRRQGREVAERRGGGDQGRGPEDLLEEVLELGVARRGHVGPARGELGAVALDHLDRALLEPLVRLEPQVGARTEVEQGLAVDLEHAARGGLVLGVAVHEPALVRLVKHFIGEIEIIGCFTHWEK